MDLTPPWTKAELYDSSARRIPVAGQLRELWRYRGLLRLLVVRDVTLRYKRSWLGIWWTLLSPLLTIAIMWIVFSHLFASSQLGVPYIVYLLSGVVVVSLFQQAVEQVGTSIVASSDLLSSVYAPPEVFALSAAAATIVTFAASTGMLLVVQLVLGVGIPSTALLIPGLALALLGFALGVGLVVAALSVRFYDTIDLTRVALYALALLTPTFYPITIVSGRLRTLLMLNPLYHYAVVFRSLAYQGTAAPMESYAVVAVTSVGGLLVGTWFLGVSWRRLAVML